MLAHEEVLWLLLLAGSDMPMSDEDIAVQRASSFQLCLLAGASHMACDITTRYKQSRYLQCAMQLADAHWTHMDKAVPMCQPGPVAS